MGENSKIEWTDHTFNPWVGCQKVSPGCKFCYAERDFTRKPRWANTWGPPETSERIRTSDANWRKPLAWNEQARAEGRRYRVFCASLADVFEDNPQVVDWRVELFELMHRTAHLDWLVLTKRPENVNRMIADIYGDCYWLEDYGKHIWIGTSVEDQLNADKRRTAFEDIPSIIKFVSYEPALGKVDWQGWDFIDWLICGGESGPGARPMHPDWARSARDWTQDNNVAFFFKQHGAWISRRQIADFTKDGWKVRPERLDAIRGKEWGCLDIAGKYWKETTTWNGNEENFVDDYEATVYRVGKKAAGRLLDGREWSEFPERSLT